MSDPRWRPRSFAVNPLEYGKVHDIDWIDVSDDAAADIRDAARVQHYWAYRVLVRLGERGLSIRRYSKFTGRSYERNALVLRGEAIVKMEEFTQSHRLLGEIFETDSYPLHGFTIIGPPSRHAELSR